MNLPQPFQYQGSKRALAALILQHLPGPGGAGPEISAF
jgi:site-specific DNA-adenine methylase